MKPLIIALLCLLPTLNYSQELVGDASEMKKNLANIGQFSKSVMSSDYQGIGQAYTEDAKIFPSNLDIIVGREAIMNYWVQPEGSRIKHHKITPEEIKITGDEAYDYGYYEGISVNSEGSESSWKGKYVIIWRKVDDNWKIYLDIWNRMGLTQYHPNVQNHNYP